MPKEPCIRTLMESQHVEGSETLLKSGRKYICHFFDHSGKRISSKNPVLVVHEILRLLVNILTPDVVFSLSKSECLMQPVQMLSSQNQKIFSELFSAFLKVT